MTGCRVSILVYFSFIFFSSFCSLASVSPPEFSIDRASGKICDKYGRERIFHGLNVVVKGAPWAPSTGEFDTRMSLSAKDIKILNGLGLNVVRLGVMWPGVEPSQGAVNGTYMTLVAGIVRNLREAGIYSLLEMHQDVFGARFCGEGVPNWLVQGEMESSGKSSLERNRRMETQPSDEQQKQEVQGDDPQQEGRTREIGKHGQQTPRLASNGGQHKSGTVGSQTFSAVRQLRSLFSFQWKWPCIFTRSCEEPSAWEYAATFPEPLSRRYDLEVDSSGRSVNDITPTQQQCLSIDWGNYHLTYAVARAFGDLYSNKWGWGDAMARYWAAIARTFKDEPGVLGYELINEPWVGNQFADPTLLLPGIADAKTLLPFYDRLQAAIWKEDQSHMLFFASIVFDFFRCGFTRVPGGEQFTNMSVLAYHYYRPPNLGVHAHFLERMHARAKIGCGAFLTEFSLPSQSSSKVFVTGKQRGADMWQSKDRSSQTENVQGAVPKPKGWILRMMEKYLPVTAKGTSLPVTGQTLSDNMAEFIHVIEAADFYGQSWIGWEFKPFINKTGSNWGVFDQWGGVNPVVARKVARTYPRAVAGTIVSFSFAHATGLFSLTYVASSSVVAPGEATEGSPGVSAKAAKAVGGAEGAADISTTTEVFFHREYYYNFGVEIVVEPKDAVEEQTVEENLLLLRHKKEYGGQTMKVTITPTKRNGPLLDVQ
eukprot:TRINITY_DN32630_c0_g1_i1.p1 TRINITY_DN32630_c0_g1~~TRINITY_DN32630_c0_g1_i1.p1  ORF type:complete len:709 (+),score=41.06 TRINITY_DN32630_c0_g1_i1:143-2269(+)